LFAQDRQNNEFVWAVGHGYFDAVVEEVRRA
jgi:hypothetical protein